MQSSTGGCISVLVGLHTARGVFWGGERNQSDVLNRSLRLISMQLIKVFVLSY